MLLGSQHCYSVQWQPFGIQHSCSVQWKASGISALLQCAVAATWDPALLQCAVQASGIQHFIVCSPGIWDSALYSVQSKTSGISALLQCAVACIWDVSILTQGGEMSQENLRKAPEATSLEYTVQQRKQQERPCLKTNAKDKRTPGVQSPVIFHMHAKACMNT